MHEIKNFLLERDKHASDIIPYYVGREKCISGHKFGPHIREHFIIHFCLDGRGVLYDKHGEHRIERGELFIIRRGEVTIYVADSVDPWEYAWIAFDGELAPRFANTQSVRRFDGESLLRFLSCIERDIRSPEIYTAFIFELMHTLSLGNGEREDGIAEVARFIKLNYMEDITVESISRAFGFERSYLFRAFRKRYSMGVKEYIIKLRMHKARALLAEGYSVGECASIVGYRDEFNFSKAYKRYYGTPPIKDKR